MRITKIKIKNFRLLKDITIELEEDLSVVIGKNNCGKTSLLLILDKFMGNGYSKNSFSFDDFNVDFKEKLKSRIEGAEPQGENSKSMGLSLKLFIEYDEEDDLSNIGNKVIMDLDPENRMVVLLFEYYISEERFEAFTQDYKEYCDSRKSDNKKIKDVFSFLKDHHTLYFKTSRKSLYYNIELQKEDEEVFTDLLKEKIQMDKIINFKWISAKRSVSNNDSEKSLSSQSSRMYKRLEANCNDTTIIDKFKDALSNTDDELDKIYEELFEEVIYDVKKFGGIKQDDSILKIVSSLKHQDLLEENTTVMYGLGNTNHSLPENYNGLGYMNLISMIFEIKILLHDFQKEKNEKPADINLLFIEEPEVHTHPQMQRIFIKNIKTLLQNGVEREDGENRKLQTILSTHSSYIVSESDFEDIKYFKRCKDGIISKNLKDLRNEYSTKNSYYKFLKQYLTLHRAELFFADKVVFIEGDTERILLPAMMRKIDQNDVLREIKEGLDKSLPLLSQNISIIEVGAYSQIFEKFIDFIGVKSLIITDIDSIKTVPQIGDDGEIKKNKQGMDKTKDESCPVSEGTKTSNSSLKYFFGSDKSLDDFKKYSLDEKKFKKDKIDNDSKWIQTKDGHLLCVYQTIEANDNGEEYYPRSFEDAFFHVNKEFIAKRTYGKKNLFIGAKTFPSLVQAKMKEFAKSEISTWEMVDAVTRKPTFAMEILLNSTKKEIAVKNKNLEDASMTLEFSNWNIPAYIMEGLQWLKQD